MAYLFRLQLLGSLQVERAGEAVRGFKSRKALALLAYLATEGQPISRSYLVELFWPEGTESRGRNNLSQALHSLSTIWPDCFRANRHSVQFRRSAANWLDITAFNELVAKGEVSALVTAADLYRGDFMEDMYLDDCPEFEQWLRLQQETWRQRVIRVLQDLIAHHADRNELDPALQFVSRLLAIDPYDEEGHRRKMLLLAQSGQRSAALAQFESCCHLLIDELGVEPTQETVQLNEQIGAGEVDLEIRSLAGQESLLPIYLSPYSPPSAAFNNLPAQATSFIGRETELAVINMDLANPNCRLLTIVGMGGIGKTRLALQAAAATNRFFNGVCFAHLTNTVSAEFIISSIADTLNFPLYSRANPKAQLLNYLSQKEMLLVLDNFEHLISGAALLTEILQAAPGIKILVTSRERLGLREEWVLDLQGLPFPESYDRGKMENYSAVRLFVSRAQQARADFWLTFLDKPAVARICRLVEGLPLGIELAAAWTRTFTCQEIAAEIEKNYNFLTTSLPNIPQRHQSLQAVFEHSLKFLSKEERRIFLKLSIFRGGFSRKSAERVVGASPMLLSTLVDKSLLRWTVSDRYEMHELLRQFSAKMLSQSPKEKERGQYLHCKHYAAFLQRQEERLRGGMHKEALDAISADIDNIRAGWHWAITRGREREIEKYLEGLFAFYNIQSRFHQGEAVFRRAAAGLRQGGATKANLNGKSDKILGQVLVRQGLFCTSLGNYEKARAIMQETLSIFQDPVTRREAPLSLNYLGAMALALGEYPQARQLCRESLLIATEIGDRWKEALSQGYLSLAALNMGQYLEARELALESLVIFREFGYRSGIACSLNILGIGARNLGEYPEAKQLCQESLLIAREIGDQWEEALSLEYLGKIAISEGEYVEAKEFAGRSLAIFRKFDYSSGIAFALNLLGTSARKLKQYAEAKQLHQQVLQTCKYLDYKLGVALASYHLGHTEFLLKDYGAARRLITESLEVSKQLAYKRGISRALSALGSLACALEQYQEAKKYLYEALKSSHEIQAIPIILDVLTELANLLIKENKIAQALELLTFSSNHAASEQETKDKADILLVELTTKLPGQMVAAVQAKSKTRGVEEIVANILSNELVFDDLQCVVKLC